MTTTAQALVEQEKSQENKSSVKKVKKNKKKRVSKHILEARGDGSNVQPTENVEEVTNPALSESSKTKNKKRKRNDRCKDPTEVLTYLSTWKAHKENNAIEWKYNKNTQSWLIRHMYDSDKVPKNVFSIAVEYLLGIQSETLKQRIIDDATRRALRYKQYEKEHNTNNSEGGEDKQKNNNTSDIDGNASTKDTEETNQQQQDDEHWMKLDDHDKRKEYKRARKILDLFQQE